MDTQTSGYFITAELRTKHLDQLAETRSALVELCTKSEQETGCTLFQLHEDSQTPGRFLLWERFDNKAAFDQHFIEEHTKEYVARNLTEVVRYFQTDVVNN
jgi:quinol monooxygenase YgiN